MAEPKNPRSSPDQQDAVESPVPAQWSMKRRPHVPHAVEPIFVPEPPRDHAIQWPSNVQGLSPAAVSEMISATAYSLAARRGFHDGYDIDDWLGAEAEVNARLDEIKRAARVGTPAG